MTDGELIEACRRGDESAFETLYHRHRDWAVSLAFRYCGNREDALDVLQETFAYLLSKLPTLELRAKLRTFLFPAVKHRALDKRRAAARLHPMPELEPEGTAAMPGDVRELWAGLKEIHRAVLELRFLEGFDTAEIAAVLRIPPGTVKSRLHHALRELRGKLDDA